MENICCLDREALGRLFFWREFRLAAKEKGSVKILTHKKDFNDLPIDLKLLLKRVSNNDQRIGAILGLSPAHGSATAKASTKTVGIVMIGLITIGIIFLIRNQYKFMVSTNPDGAIEIDAQPSGA